MGNSLISLSSLSGVQFVHQLNRDMKIFHAEKHIFTKDLCKSTTLYAVRLVFPGKSSVLSVVQPNFYPCYVVYVYRCL